MTDTASATTRYRAAVDAHKDLVYAAALRQLRDPASADDATQAVFLVLLKKLPTLPEARPLAPWLLTVTRHVCNDARKHDRRRRLHEMRSAMRTPSESASRTGSDLEYELDNALAALSKNERDALTLRFLQQLDIPAVATALHITESNAKKRITRALANLRDYFTRHQINLSAASATTLLTHAATIHAPPHLAANLPTLSTKTASTAALALSRAATQKLLLTTLKLPATLAALLAITAGTAILTPILKPSPASPATSIAATTTAPAFTATLHQPAGRGWVHVHWDVGQLLDEWENLQTGESFIVRRDGDIYVSNKPQHWELFYSSSEGVIDKKVTEDTWTPVTAAEMWPFPTHYVTATSETLQPATTQPTVLRYGDSLQSVAAFRFDQYGTDMYGKIHRFDQFWRDAKTNNPLLWKRLLTESERQEEGRDVETATFDYPETGPANIYELRVPRDTPIHALAPTPKNAQQILDAIKTQYANFPTHYRAITMDVGAVLPRTKDNLGTIQHMEILWANGDGLLYRGYSPLDRLSPTATPAQILDWASHNEPFFQRLQTKFISYDWHHYSGEKPTVQAKRTNPGAFSTPSMIPEIFWPMHNMTPNFTLLPHSADTPDGSIGLHYEGPNNWHADFFVDPRKDYLCLKQINYAFRDGDFLPSQIITLTDLHPVAGHWIAGKQIRHDFADPDRNIYESESITTITYQPLTPADYPSNLFDPKPLLEGATKIGY